MLLFLTSNLNDTWKDRENQCVKTALIENAYESKKGHEHGYYVFVVFIYIYVLYVNQQSYYICMYSVSSNKNIVGNDIIRLGKFNWYPKFYKHFHSFVGL